MRNGALPAPVCRKRPRMKPVVLAALAATLSLSTAASVLAQPVATAEGAGRAIGHHVAQTGRATGHAVANTGRFVGHATLQTGRDASHGFRHHRRHRRHRHH